MIKPIIILTIDISPDKKVINFATKKNVKVQN